MIVWNAVILIVVLLLLSQARAEDSRCSQLRALNQQYSGVSLSPVEKVAKGQLVGWYKANCMKVGLRKKIAR